MSKIFISHSSPNTAAALAIASWLEQNGWSEYFLDVNPQQGLAPGERWQEALKLAADRCEVVLFLISPAWCGSRWCLAEFLLAKQLGKKIFGALIEPTQLDTLPNEMASEWQLCDLSVGAERCEFRVRADPVGPDTIVSFATQGLERLKIGLRKAGLDASTFPWPPARDAGRAPYRGLKPLEADDAAVFFGREVAITRGLDALRRVRERGVEGVFVILGASGAGKSSYLRAGLWPRLARDDRQFVPLPLIRPQGAVITGSTGLVASLETAFRDRKIARTRAEIRTIVRSPGGLVQLISELQTLARKPFGPDSPLATVLLPIDQGEELFVSEGREENDALLAMLGGALTAPTHGGPQDAGRLITVIAIRSDSYDRLQSDPRLAATVHVPFNLSPIARAEFKAIITGPADRAAAAGQRLRIDPALTERLLQDAEGADALPLLAFVLERLYVDYGGDGELSVGDYDALGGVRGSIEAAVEAAFADPGREPVVSPEKAEREQLLRRAFIPWLAGIDPDTEKRRRRVATWDEIPTPAHAVLERLIDARLLLRDRRAVEGGTHTAVVVEVAHEALLRQWPALTAWLDEDADALKATEGVRRAAGEWIKNHRGGAWLIHTGERLQIADALSRRPDLEHLMGDAGRDYLSACRARDQQARADRDAQLTRIAVAQARTARAQRFSKWLLAAIGIVLLAFGGWVVVQSRDVARQRSRVLIVAAEEALTKHSFDRALRFAVLAADSTWLSPVVPDGEPQLARAAYLSLETARVTHNGAVYSAAFSPDGQRIVSASEDKTARVSDARTAKEIARVTHAGRVFSATFSRDGRRVATASEDKTARVSDADSGREITRVTHSGSVFSVAFSPDGRRIVTASEDGTARISDAQTGKEIARVTGGAAVRSVVFSPDGQLILSASADMTARVSDAQTGMEITRIVHDAAGGVNIDLSVEFSPDGQRIVSAPDALRTARVSDAHTGREIARVTHEQFVSSVAFSSDGQRIVTASDDKTARVSDAWTGREIGRVSYGDSLRSAAFSPDGRILAVSVGTVRVNDPLTGKEFARLTHNGLVLSAKFSPDGQRIVSASLDNTARVSDTQSGKELARITHEGFVLSAAFSPDGQRIVTADRTARVSDAQSGKEIARVSHDGTVVSAAFSPDGQRIVTGSFDKTARVSDAQTGKEIARVIHDGTVVSAAFSPDGRRIVTASADKTARVSDAQTGKEVTRVTHDGRVSSATFSADDRRIVTASNDKTARVSDAQTGREIARITHDAIVSSAAFSPNGRRIVTASVDKTMRISEALTGKEIRRVTFGDPIGSAAFSPDGQRILATSDDGTVRVIDVQTGQEIARTKPSDIVAGAISAVFSPDGQRILATPVGMVQVFAAQTGREIAEVSDDVVRLAVFSPDAQRILIISAQDKSARVVDARWLTWSGRDLLETVCRQKLVGTNRLTVRDVEAAPVLAGREGEDVCNQASLIERLTMWWRRGRAQGGSSLPIR